MQYQIEEIKNKIICGDALEILRKFPSDSIDMVITSPPYWGLRRNLPDNDPNKKYEIGLESSFEEYMDKMIEVMKEIKRVMKPTGTCWVNFGDAYGGQPAGAKSFVPNFGKEIDTKKSTIANPESNLHRGRAGNQKCLLMMPERFAIRCIDEVGLILRNQIIWCLEENTPIFCKINEEYKLMKIKDLELVNKEVVKIPALDKQGIKWVRLKNIWYAGEKEAFEIELTNGKKVIAGGDHLFPAFASGKRRKFLKLHFLPVNKLKSKYHKFYVASKISREEEIVSREEDYESGLLVGWYLAEGSGAWTSHPHLSVNQEDLKKLKFLIDKWNLRVKKQKTNEAYDVYLGVGGKGQKGYKKGNRPLVNIIRKYILGKNCGEKRFTDEIWNTSLEFLRGVIDGFCEGDGSWDEENKRWRIRIKKNPLLVQQLETICLLIGKQFRIENSEKAKGFGKEYKKSSFSIQDWDKRILYKNLSFQMIRNIKSLGIRKMYDFQVEPVYYTRHQQGETKDKKKKKWNGIYFLGNGILTHNCKQALFFNKDSSKYTKGSVMPTSVKDRFNQSYEYLFFFTKSKKYYSNLDAVRIPAQTFENRPMGIEREREWYPNAKRNKFALNYRVRDALKKAGQPQFRASEEEISRYQQEKLKVYPKGQGGHLKFGGINSSEGQRIYWEKLISKYAKGSEFEQKYGGPWDRFGENTKKAKRDWRQEEAGGYKMGSVDPHRAALRGGLKYYKNPDPRGNDKGGPGSYRLWKDQHPYQGKFAGREDAELFNSPRARTQRKSLEKRMADTKNKDTRLSPAYNLKKLLSEARLGIRPNTGMIPTRNKTIIDPNAKGLRQAPEPGEPNALHPFGKNIPTVWQINPEPHSFKKELGEEFAEHFSIFPEKLLEVPILFGSPVEGIVLDPFAGSFTTALVAEKLGRNWIGIELSEDYCKLGQARIAKWRRENKGGLFNNLKDISPPSIIKLEQH